MSILNKNTIKLRKLQQEIKEYKAQLESLNEEKNAISEIVDQIGDLSATGYLIFNYNSGVLIANATLKELLSNCVPGNEINTASLTESVHPEERSILEEIFNQPKNAGKKISHQLRFIQKAKDYKDIKFFQINGIYFKAKSQEIKLICTFRDTTRDNRQQKESQRLLEKAIEADKIKTLFLLNISHNIRTPMNSILGFAELLGMTDPGSERRNEFIQVIKRQSKNLLQIIDDVAEIAKYESGSLNITKIPVNLNHLINEIVRDVDVIRSESRKQHVKIQVELPSKKGLEMYTDAGRLHQVFINILNHSLRYTIDGSILLGYHLPTDSKIEFFIMDTSQGLDKEYLKNIFDRLGQLTSEQENRYNEGAALNLIIAKSIVKLLGGKLIFEPNDDNQGFTFTFQLPFEMPPDLGYHGIEDEINIGKYNWKNKVVLIVEDEEVNGLFLEAVFQETGARTLYAKNGKQAIELCQSISKIDLILMDIKMPVMNGLKATEEIRKFNKSIPIIAQTALALEEDRHNCLLSGCNETITKPIEVAELLNLVNRYISH